MIFETHQITGVLDQYIESIFYFKDFMPDHSIERVVPTGHLFIIFELDGFTRNTFDNETLKPNNSFTKVWISGMHKNHISISAHQRSEMFVIQFKPYGAHPFFHIPIQELNEKVIPAERILGNEILELREEILSKKTVIEKFKNAEQWLVNQFHKDKTPPRGIISIVERLQTQSTDNYSKIIDDYPKTQKHLIDEFKKYIGLTPKYFQRVLRFNEILQQIHESEKIEWSQIAYQFKYADQIPFYKRVQTLLRD